MSLFPSVSDRGHSVIRWNDCLHRSSPDVFSRIIDLSEVLSICFWSVTMRNPSVCLLASEAQHSISERGNVERWPIPVRHPGLKIDIAQTLESRLVSYRVIDTR